MHQRLLIQNGIKAGIEAHMEPSIQTDYFLSGTSMNLILNLLGAKSETSFLKRSTIFGNIAVPSDYYR